MANLTRYDPFDLTFEPFDNLFRGFIQPVRFENQPQQLQIKMDVKETDKNYAVHAEIPGVKKEDIHVAINGKQVSISAEVKKEKEEKEGAKVLRSERYYGKLYRSFTLDQDVDEATAVAKYTDGVLDLTLPKKKSSEAKKLTIQ
ncbi:heat-shock protein Hsp20 [Sulfuriferula sp. AH1]|uniref:Hsp20/alpha crystallin family protein n=1 Tax=Sulfuriferula sp. AH1 TaxID=1985873 RepID=UPI000B3B2C14|nr:Hsp20/alpha crystallin family protein [Sulfuriferula sp. AH1]ARU31355.1 heat-shock protein Hsp20 [Sulfuriferula sp. AH1]